MASFVPKPVIFTCGCGHDGRLGHNSETNLSSLTPVEFFQQQHPDLIVESIHVGGFHSFAKTSKGVYGWGDNTYGQLGLDERSFLARMKPTLIDFLSRSRSSSPSSSSFVVDLQCGAYHTVALCSDGHLYACGRNDQGQLGLGDTENQAGFKQVPLSIDNLLKASSEEGGGAGGALSQIVLAAGASGGESRLEISQLSCGSYHTCALCTVRPKVEEILEGDDDEEEGAASSSSRKRHHTVVFSCGKGDFGELGYDADGWDLLMKQEQNVKNSVRDRAAFVAQGGDSNEYYEARENGGAAGAGGSSSGNAATGLDKFKAKHKPKKERRAAFFHPAMRLMTLGAELLTHLHDHPEERISFVRAEHHHTQIRLLPSGSIWHCGCYYCNEIEGKETSQMRRLIISSVKEAAAKEAEGGSPEGVEYAGADVDIITGDEFCVFLRKSSSTGNQRSEDASEGRGKIIEVKIIGKGKLGLGDEDEDWADDWTSLVLPAATSSSTGTTDGSSACLVPGVTHFGIFSKSSGDVATTSSPPIFVGDNYFGQLACGNDSDCYSPQCLGSCTPSFPRPPFNNPGEYRIADIQLGFRHTVVLLLPITSNPDPAAPCSSSTAGPSADSEVPPPSS